MYHQNQNKTSVSLKMRQCMGDCINMNNQEKNTYVRTQILTTLLKMMKDEPIQSITITDIVSKAQVGRASFYRNYQSKEDVLRQEAERLTKELKIICKNDNPNDIQLKLVRTMDFYKKHSNFYMILYKSGLKQIIQDSIVDKSIIPSNASAPLAYTISAFSYLIYGWIIEWIHRGMKESIEDLQKLFENLQENKQL